MHCFHFLFVLSW